jgi:hypothetical protein
MSGQWQAGGSLFFFIFSPSRIWVFPIDHHLLLVLFLARLATGHGEIAQSHCSGPANGGRREPF